MGIAAGLSSLLDLLPGWLAAPVSMFGGASWAAVLRDLNREEILAFAFCAAVVAVFGRRKWRRSISAPRGMRAVALIAALAILPRLLLLPVLPVPDPHVHDEFSYLLQADTFQHGRLTNPTPAFWQHFETMHVFLQPTYNSMYFPMQGLLLAIGGVLGHPWIGVLLSSAAMCGAIVWMLQGWMPSRWAFAGGLLAVCRTSVFSYWINGYYGGAHSALGGALVLGAWPRLARRSPEPRRRIVHAIVLGIGLVILANGRPYEGLLLSIPIAVGMFVFQKRPALDGRVFVPVTLVLLAGAAALGYYCWRVTGSPVKTPYQVNRETYGWPQTLLFLDAPPAPQFRHQPMAEHYAWEYGMHTQAASAMSLLFQSLLKAITVWSFYAGPALSIPLLMLPMVWRNRRFRPLLFPAGALLGGLSMSQSVVPHYAAPAAGAIFGIVIQGIRHLRFCRWRGLAIGRALALAIPMALAMVLAIRVATLEGVSVRMGEQVFSWCCMPRPTTPGLVGRADFLRQLQGIPGDHLVMVRYAPKHSFHNEWVYNEAEISRSRVIWARQMSPAEDQRLINYYRGRRVWMMEPDASPPRITEIHHAE